MDIETTEEDKEIEEIFGLSQDKSLMLMMAHWT